MEGLKEGFRIGFDYAGHTCTPAKRNILLASHHSEVTKEYLKEECTLRCIIGPFDGEKAKGIHISRFGVIPKPHKPGKWRLMPRLFFVKSHVDIKIRPQNFFPSVGNA